MAIVRRMLWPGAPKAEPFLILIVRNPVMERGLDDGYFSPDPIQADNRLFGEAVRTISDSLGGFVPGQLEPAFIDPAFGPDIRLEVIEFDGDDDQRCYITHKEDMIVARQQELMELTQELGITADIVYAVTASYFSRRASAWYTYDDDASRGTPYVYDGATAFHRERPIAPGSIGIHATCEPMTVTHEFGHAISSFQNGQVVDLYVDAPVGMNKRAPRPPTILGFANYNATPFGWDPSRGGIGYPSHWASYHCELNGPTLPALMDNYWLAAGGASIACRHDRITSAFICDRIRAKLAR